MKIGMLEHVNLFTSRLDEMLAWYDRYLSMKPGWRPNFPFPGAWLYSGDNKPTIHLVGVETERPNGSKLEHFAFSAVGLKSCIDTMKQGGIDYELVAVPEARLIQVNVFDPDGNHIHIDFPSHEQAELGAEKIGGFTGLPGQKQM